MHTILVKDLVTTLKKDECINAELFLLILHVCRTSFFYLKAEH